MGYDNSSFVSSLKHNFLLQKFQNFFGKGLNLVPCAQAQQTVPAEQIEQMFS